MSESNRGLPLSIAAGASRLVALLVLTGCSVVPDWSEPEVREYRITAHYAGRPAPRTVPLPSSSRHLLILELAVQQGELRETYRDADRRLLVPAGDQPLRLDCRYRLFRRHAADGTPLPWPSPDQLFPGASHIVHHQ